MLTSRNRKNRLSVNTALALATMAAISASPLFAQSAPQPSPDQSVTTPAAPAPSGSSSAAPGGTRANSASGIAATPQNSNSSNVSEATPAPIDVQQLLSSTVSAVLTPDPANPLTAQLSTADQARLKDLGNSTVLNETVAQLQKAFQEKYGTPLDLRQNQHVVFPEDSFRIGVAMAVVRDEPEAAAATHATAPASGTTSSEPAAQQASSVSSPDTTATAPPRANTSASPQANGTTSNTGTGSSTSINGTTSSNASASANASANANSTAAPGNAAGANAAPTLTRRISVTVPEANGLPETGLKLANNAGAWAIDVPNGVTLQSLEQSLQQQLQLAMNTEWPDDPNVASQMIARHVLLALASEGSTGQVGNAVRVAPERVQPSAPEVNAADAAVAEPTSRPVRQTYREKREAERAAREAKRAAQVQERQQKQQEQHQERAPAASDTTDQQRGRQRQAN